MRKQLDFRWKQIDKFEAALKTVAETRATWRKKLSSKEGEVEALKVSFVLHPTSCPLANTMLLQATNSELQAQLVSTRKPGTADAMEVRSLTTRATIAERRLANVQNQLLASEEKITVLNEKTAASDAKWEARVKEYEARQKVMEEKVKRERQGGKERALELENQMKCVFLCSTLGFSMTDK